MFRITLFLVIALVCGVAAAANPVPDLGVGYDVDAPEDLDRSFDYFPAKRPGGALVIFVHSRFWAERQPVRLVHSGFVKGAIQQGHSVAVVRHRIVSAGPHPTQIRDVARGVAVVLDRARREGLDMRRVFLAGHSSGAQLVLLLALDSAWLGEQGASSGTFAGVISLSGILDLASASVSTPEEEAFYARAFPSSEGRRAASPIEHVDTKRPAILVMTAARDIAGYAQAAERFVNAARASGSGAVERFVAPGRDHFSILDLAGSGSDGHVSRFLASDPFGGALPEMWQVASTWRNPPFSTLPFHSEFGALAREYESNPMFGEAVNRPFPSPNGSGPRLRFGRFQAIALTDLLEAMGPARVGSGDWLEITNVRGEKAWYSMARVRELAPLVVIGVDDEKNLFRATDLYHTRRRYSWLDAEEKRVDMARPLGGFLFFPKEDSGDRNRHSLFGRYALTIDSFRRVEGDPRAALADLPALARDVITERHQCVSCHRVRETGGRASHIRASDGVEMGGHALPLERYPAAVWKRFVFEQAVVAEEVGANAVEFTAPEAQALYDAIVAERTRRAVTPWERPDRSRD